MPDYRRLMLDEILHIEEATDTYKRDVLAAAFNFRDAKRTDFTEYVSTVQERKRAEIRQAFLLEIASARNSYKSAVTTAINVIRDIYYEALTSFPAKTNALDALRVYAEFEIPMTKDDVLAVASQTDGNLLALRALSSIASRSGLAVSVPLLDTPEDICNGLEDALHGFMMLPEFLDVSEVVDTLPQPVNGLTKALTAQVDAAVMRDALAAVADVKNEITRQKGALSLRFEQKQTAEEEKPQRKERSAEAAPVTVSEDDHDAERLATRIGIEKSTNETAARVITDAYTMKG